MLQKCYTITPGKSAASPTSKPSYVMKARLSISLILGIVLFSCSNSDQALQNMNEHEILYNSTSDSLSNHLDVSSIKEIMLLDSTIQDYTNLDYKAFKKKYSLNDNEMDQLAGALTVTSEIAKTIKSIDDNLRQAENLKIERLNKSDSVSYSFQKVMPIDSNYHQLI